MKLTTSPRRLLAIAAAGVLATGLAACGDSDDSAASGDSIKLLTFASVSTSLQNYPDVEAGAKAAVEAINKAGGINGQQIDWDFCNTESDPNKAAACARQAGDGYAAVVGMTDTFSTAALPVLEASKVPSIGMLSFGNEADWTSSAAYPFSGGAAGAYVSAPYAAKAKGAQTIATLYTDTPASVSEADMVEQSAELAGLDYVGNIPVPLSGVTDYAPYAQKIKDLGADAVVLIASPGTTAGAFKGADSLGISPIWIHNAYSFGEADGAAAGIAGRDVIAIGPYPTFRDTDNATIAQFNKEMDDSGASQDPTVRRSAAVNSWLAVYAVKALAEDIDGPVTKESLTKALESATDVDLMGLGTWDPSKLGEGTDFARYPTSAVENFLSFDDQGQLVTSDLGTHENPFDGLTPPSN